MSGDQGTRAEEQQNLWGNGRSYRGEKLREGKHSKALGLGKFKVGSVVRRAEGSHRY